MKKLILILLSVTTLANAQNLLFGKKDNPELNTNTNLSITYTPNILNAWDFTSGFTPTAAATINNATTFTTSGAGGIFKALIAIGTTVKLNINLSSTATEVRLQNALPVPIFGTSFNGRKVYKQAAATNFYLYNTTAGETVVTTMSAYELKAPTGSVTPTMDGSNYVIDGLSGGCQFIEVTGTTYIEMEDTLAAGWYYVTPTQIYVSGELNVYNGTSEVAFPQSSGTSKKLVQLDGVHPLRLQVDNNSNITVTKLSIKRK